MDYGVTIYSSNAHKRYLYVRKETGSRRWRYVSSNQELKVSLLFSATAVKKVRDCPEPNWRQTTTIQYGADMFYEASHAYYSQLGGKKRVVNHVAGV